MLAWLVTEPGGNNLLMMLDGSLSDLVGSCLPQLRGDLLILPEESQGSPVSARCLAAHSKSAAVQIASKWHSYLRRTAC